MNKWQNMHKKYMFDVLKAIYSSKYGKLLGFKGGTALYFFYKLDRFSVDLDFDIVDKLTLEEIGVFKIELFEFLTQYFAHNKDIKIKIEGTLKNSFRFILQYGGVKKLKLEFTSQIYNNQYEYRRLFGLNIQVMRKEYMFAHKLCAFISRYKQYNTFTNRDLYDIKYFLDLVIIPNEKIILLRTKKLLGKSMTRDEFYTYIYNLIKKNKSKINKNILDGLGELVDNKKKYYMKNNFLDNLLGYLEFYLSG